jgi:hypothetical protein
VARNRGQIQRITTVHHGSEVTLGGGNLGVPDQGAVGRGWVDQIGKVRAKPTGRITILFARFTVADSFIA